MHPVLIIIEACVLAAGGPDDIVNIGMEDRYETPYPYFFAYQQLRRCCEI